MRIFICISLLCLALAACNTPVTAVDIIDNRISIVDNAICGTNGCDPF